MNREDILNMPAGREMDALVIMEFFGVMAFCDSNGHPYKIGAFQENEPVPNYSTDISAAWEVVDELVKKYLCDVSVENRADVHANNRVHICKLQYGKLQYDSPNLLRYVLADTAPLAICRAALLTTLED